MTNPFEQPQAAQQATQANPYAQQQAAPAAAPASPFAPAVQQQAAPAAQAPWLATPTPAEQASFPSAQQGYVAPQQQAAPAGPPPVLDASGLASAPPPPPEGGRGAKLPDMYGRLVLVFPLSIGMQPRNAKFITDEQRQRGDLNQERLVATVVVLDDGQLGNTPIAFGGEPYKLPPTPHTESAPLPYVRKAMWITQSRLISQLRDALPPAPGQTPGMRLGRVVKTGPEANAPWYLQGATEPELERARQYLQLVSSGAFPHPLA
jgi:hypothetical protein